MNVRNLTVEFNSMERLETYIRALYELAENCDDIIRDRLVVARSAGCRNLGQRLLTKAAVEEQFNSGGTSRPLLWSGIVNLSRTSCNNKR